MQNLNIFLFNLVNAGEPVNDWLLRGAVIVAEYFIYLIPLWLMYCWLWRPASRGALLFAVIAVLLSLSINQGLGLFWFHPRPFMMPVGHTYLTHVADSSFPSDHVTVIW